MILPKHPIHPMLSIAGSIAILFSFLWVIKEPMFPLYFLSLLLLYVAFGYMRVMLRVFLIFIPLALIVGGITKINASWMAALWASERMMVLAMASVLTISMRPIDLVRSMNQCRAPRWITLGLLIAIRFLGVMAEEYRRIKRAMKLRGVDSSWYRPTVWYRAALVPFMMRVLTISDTMALSLETRSFSLQEESTAYRVIEFRKRDGCFIFLLFLVMGWMLF